MIQKVKRYLGNVNTLEVHDVFNEQVNCQLDEILAEHRRWYDTFAGAKADQDYDTCYWCIGSSQR